jgi:hypothetical protein
MVHPSLKNRLRQTITILILFQISFLIALQILHQLQFIFTSKVNPIFWVDQLILISPSKKLIYVLSETISQFNSIFLSINKIDFPFISQLTE